jgi:hypothetical protein
MATWTEDKLELWIELASDDEFGVEASYGAFTFRCIKNPVRSSFVMTMNAYDKQADTIIDTLRSDAVANGLYALIQSDPQEKRPIVTISNERYEILGMENDDNTEPSIRLKALRLQ